jgi:hypothetical protein
MGHRRKWRIYHIHKIYKVLLFPLALWANLGGPPPPKARENGVARHFAMPFCSQTCKKNFEEYSESSFPDGSNDTNFSCQGLFWAEQLLLKMQKRSVRSISVPETSRNSSDCFFGFNPLDAMRSLNYVFVCFFLQQLKSRVYVCAL